MYPSDNEIKLRPVVHGDEERLAALANNKNIWDNLRDYMPYPYTVAHALGFIERTARESPRLTFGIEFKGELCGVTGLNPQQDVYAKTAEIGYWLGEEHWGKGIASRALRLLTNYGLSTAGFVRLHTGVYEHNTASMRVLEKCGYQKEGIFKSAVFKNGKIIDEHRYAITRQIV